MKILLWHQATGWNFSFPGEFPAWEYLWTSAFLCLVPYFVRMFVLGGLKISNAFHTYFIMYDGLMMNFGETSQGPACKYSSSWLHTWKIACPCMLTSFIYKVYATLLKLTHHLKVLPLLKPISAKQTRPISTNHLNISNKNYKTGRSKRYPDK